MKVYLAGQPVPVDPASLLGVGGEAEVYDLGGGRVLKLFKGPDHPDVQGSKAEREAAAKRLEEHQEKLRAFPGQLPAQVVAPGELATTRGGRKVLGYAMKKVEDPFAFARYADPGLRKQGLRLDEVVAALRELHATLRQLHARDVVVGDLNDLNLLVAGGHTWVIDADSFQLPGYPCRVYTERFVDPLLCDPAASSPRLAREYTWEADWYAFAVLAQRSLLGVGPYGGVFRPASKSARVPHGRRPLERISIYRPGVRYPRAAAPLEALPDEWNQHMQAVLHQDRRGLFPARLLEELEFQACKACGLQHARLLCPVCRPVTPPASAPRATRVRGEVRAEVVFRSPGVILAAALQGGKLRVLHHHEGRYLREDGSVWLEGPLDPAYEVHLQGRTALVARGRELVALAPDAEPVRAEVDRAGPRAAVAAHEAARVWAHQGRLWRDGKLGAPEALGEVLAGNTWLWLGPRFGLGFYRAGRMWVGFRFDPARPGIRDDLEFPRVPGQLVDARCWLDDGRAWLELEVQHRGRRRVLLRVYARDGELLAAHEEDAEPGGWAGGPGGKLASSGVLLAPSAEGLVRVETVGRMGLAVTRRFPDTEPFVDEASRLLAGPQGLYVVGEQTVTALQLGRPRP